MRNKSALPDNDPLQTTLNSLRSDIERTPLADSLSVRRRGEARSRHQAVAGALVLAALVAGVFGVADLRGTGCNSGIPAHLTPSPTASAAIFSLAADPFLKSTDLTGLGRFGNLPVLQASQPPDLTPPANVCQIRPTGWNAMETRASRYYQDGSTVGIVEVVQRYATAAEAKTALNQPGRDLAACPQPDPADGNLEVRPPEALDGVADGVLMSRLFTPSAASEASYYEVAAARVNNVVVVLQWGADDTPTGDPNSWAWSAPQMQSALDAAVAR
jgi:hypothetical protein